MDTNELVRKSFIDGYIKGKKDIIDKACEWLSGILYIHTEVEEDKHCGTTKSYDYVTSDHDSIDDFINEFRKVMEDVCG